MFALRWLDLEQQLEAQPDHAYEIQVFPIGDLAVVGWPGEPFVEAQLEVKRGSPAKYVVLGHLCNGEPGYLPTRRAFKAGGYETRWTSLPEGALETVTERTVEMVRKLFA